MALQERGLLRQDQRPPLDVRARYAVLRDAMCAVTGLQDLGGPARYRTNVWARNLVMYQLRLDGFSLHQVGESVGRDHTTVVHAIGSVERMFAQPLAYVIETEMWRKFQRKLAGKEAAAA